MANLGSIKVGAYGKYYAYVDHGERKNLGLSDQGEDLTPDQLDELIDKETLTFMKDGVEIHAKLVSYFNKHKNKWAQFISYKGADELEVIARTDDGEIMAVKHRKYPVVGLQFHPESIYTEHGKRMIENFVNGNI